MSAVTEFVIAECTRQNDLNPQSVAEMVEGWYFAKNYLFSGNDKIDVLSWVTFFTVETIKELGRVVKSQNKGFRNTPVVFANGNSGASYRDIERLLEKLLDAFLEKLLNADEFYYEFERIHPFEDGNGRVGAILWNIINGYFDKPVCPPEMFEDN